MNASEQASREVIVAVSCGYDTCFAVKTCDGLYHFIFSIDRVGIPFRVRLYSEIDQIHLSIEAQCVTALLPLGDCHSNAFGSIHLLSVLCLFDHLYESSHLKNHVISASFE